MSMEVLGRKESSEGMTLERWETSEFREQLPPGIMQKLKITRKIVN